MGGQAALPRTPPQGRAAESPAHEAQPWGPARPSAQIPCPCPSLVDRPTSVQGCYEVPEKPPGAPPTFSLNSILDPRTQLPNSAQGEPRHRDPVHGPSHLLGTLDPSAPAPLPHLSETHQAFGGHLHCAYTPLSPQPTYTACFLQLRTSQAHCLQGVAVSTGVKAQLLSF